MVGEDTGMSAIPAPQRIELSLAVSAILEVDTPKSQLLKHFLRFTEALLAPDLAGIDSTVTSDARFHELEAIGYPRGPEGFKMFRRQVNAAIPDKHIFIIAVEIWGFPSPDGRYLAILGEATNSNVWMLEGF